MTLVRLKPGHTAAAAVLVVGGLCVVGALGLAFTSKRQHQHAPDAGAGLGARWACEMACEGKKLYLSAGACPVCRMAFTRVSERPYLVKVAAAGQFFPGASAAVRVQLLDPDAKPVSDLDSSDGHAALVVFTSDDLSWACAAIPALGPDAAAIVPVTFPKPGRYQVYADFRPQGLGRQTPSAAFRVGAMDGDVVADAKTLEEDFDTVMHRDDYEIRVRCNGAPFVAATLSFLRFGVDKGGESIGDFEPILGQPGHVFILQINPRKVVMAHAASIRPFLGAGAALAVTDPKTHTHLQHEPPSGAARLPVTLSNSNPTDIVVQAVFPEPGLYRVIAVFDHRGRILTVPFTIDAKPGLPEPASAPTAASVQ